MLVSVRHVRLLSQEVIKVIVLKSKESLKDTDSSCKFTVMDKLLKHSAQVVSGSTSE